MAGRSSDAIPCPQCGCQMTADTACAQCGARQFSLEVRAEMASMQTSLVAHKPGATEALRVGDGQRSITADLSTDGILKVRLTAKRRQNEQGNREVCRILR